MKLTEAIHVFHLSSTMTMMIWFQLCLQDVNAATGIDCEADGGGALPSGTCDTTTNTFTCDAIGVRTLRSRA
jgi:hypothetical protein